MSMFARTSLRGLSRSPFSGSSSRTLFTSTILRDQQAPAQIGTGERNLVKEQEQRDVQAVEAEIVNDAPAELQQRSVRIYKPAKTANSSGKAGTSFTRRVCCIYKPAKTANSSGKAGTSFWRVDFDILSGSARWENPLMGWASSGDYMQGTFLKFRTQEDAIHFCEKQNWPYYIQTPHKARIGPKSYAANYNYSPGKLRIHHTK